MHGKCGIKTFAAWAQAEVLIDMAQDIDYAIVP